MKVKICHYEMSKHLKEVPFFQCHESITGICRALDTLAVGQSNIAT